MTDRIALFEDTDLRNLERKINEWLEMPGVNREGLSFQLQVTQAVNDDDEIAPLYVVLVTLPY